MEDRVQGSIFVSKGQQVLAGKRILHKEELNDGHFSLDVIRMRKPKRI